MTGETGLGVFAKQIKDAADVAGACLVGTVPGMPDPGSVLTVVMNPEDMARVIASAAPRVVYIDEHSFSVDQDIDEEVQERATRLVPSGYVPIEPAGLEKLRRRYAKYTASLCRVIVGFVVDSVYHTAILETGWLDSLRSELSAILDHWEQEAISVQNIEITKETAHIEAKATELATQPAFNAHPQSFENRRFLAATMFPELGADIVLRITTLAAKKSWLAKAGGMKDK
jgi:hypothetical protein